MGEGSGVSKGEPDGGYDRGGYLGCELSQSEAGIKAQCRIIGMGFYGVKDALQEWVWVGSG